MTEKRFKLIECLPNVIQIKDNNQKLNSHEIVDLLNELHEENEQLEQKNQLLYKDIDFLKGFIEERGFKIKLESDKR